MVKIFDYKWQILTGICIVLLIVLLFRKDMEKPLVREKDKQIKTLVHNLDSLKKRNGEIQSKYTELIIKNRMVSDDITKAEKKIDSLERVSLETVREIIVYTVEQADSALKAIYPNDKTRDKTILADLYEGNMAKQLYEGAKEQITLERVKSRNLVDIITVKDQEIENILSQNKVLSDMNTLKDEQLKLNKKTIRKLKFQRTASIVAGGALALLLLL